MIGAGGVSRNEVVVWINGILQNIGKADVLQAEAWGRLTELPCFTQ